MLIRDCIKAASVEYGVPVALILGPRGNREQGQARHAAMWLARCQGHTTTKIGREMHRDFSTVWCGSQRAMHWARVDWKYKRRLFSALRRLWVSAAMRKVGL